MDKAEDGQEEGCAIDGQKVKWSTWADRLLEKRVVLTAWENKSDEDNWAARLAPMTKKIRDSLLTLQKTEVQNCSGGILKD